MKTLGTQELTMGEYGIGDRQMKANSIKIIYDIPVKMRDGVTLFGNLYRPADNLKYPAVLNRTPYNKNNDWLFTGYLQGLELVRQGYNVFIQDIRGTHMSEGEYSIVGNEVNDGFDTVKWMADQEWCDGNIGMAGESAHGYTQLSAARLHPPGLKTICPFQTSFTRFPGMYSPGITPNFLIEWVADRDGYNCLPMANSASEGYERLTRLHQRTMDETVEFSPTALINEENLPGLRNLRFRRDMVSNIDNPEYYEAINRSDAFENIDVPCLCLTGWYDFLRDETIHNYLQLKTIGKSKLCREESRLIIGPWNHGNKLPRVIDGVDFGEKASIQGSGIAENMAGWFDYWLKGIDSRFINSPRVHIFVMGLNEWRFIPDWPPQTALEPFYLHSSGRANSLRGDGTFSQHTSGNERSDSFIYNPLNPVPSSTGDPIRTVIQDQQIIENRDDVLVYTSESFASDVEIIGQMKMQLYAATSAIDTDFACKISDVHPDGRSIVLTSRLVRARFRNGYPACLLEPEKIYLYSFVIGNTAIVLPRGHKLRLTITSSLFPDADANLNTGEPIGFETGYVKAVQTIFHDEDHPSAVLLPLSVI